MQPMTKDDDMSCQTGTVLAAQRLLTGILHIIIQGISRVDQCKSKD